MYKCFSLSIKNNIAHLQMNRPEKRNSMILDFWTELPEIIADIDAGSKARVIVLSSTGPHFTAGLDKSLFAFVSEADREADEDTRNIQSGAAFYHNMTQFQTAFTSLEACRIPVLAAIQGGCIGGGIDLITACDMRYGTEDSFYTIFETNLAMTADVGTFPRLINLIPEGVVREMAYTGRNVTATEAKTLGLLNRVYPDQGSMLLGVMEIATEIASKAPLAVSGCKKMITYSRDHSTKDALDYVAIWNASHFKLTEVLEAMEANKADRPGHFTSLPKRRV